ncbi:MAG: thermostable hemolysin [Rhodomicrobiaceae bacterium]
MKLIHVTSGHALWPATSLFIRTTYLDHYGARLTNLPANIIALVGGGDKIRCAAGLRDASERFFSEFYLDEPIETVISKRAGKPVGRHETVEVSSLASRTPAASVLFMRELIHYGDLLGFNWAFFTATSRLETLLHRLQLPLIDLGAASSDRVPTPELWGSYYETNPRVLAIGREDLAPFLLSLETETSGGARAHG